MKGSLFLRQKQSNKTPDIVIRCIIIRKNKIKMQRSKISNTTDHSSVKRLKTRKRRSIKNNNDNTIDFQNTSVCLLLFSIKKTYIFLFFIRFFKV